MQGNKTFAAVYIEVFIAYNRHRHTLAGHARTFVNRREKRCRCFVQLIFKTLTHIFRQGLCATYCQMPQGNVLMFCSIKLKSLILTDPALTHYLQEENSLFRYLVSETPVHTTATGCIRTCAALILFYTIRNEKCFA